MQKKISLVVLFIGICLQLKAQGNLNPSIPISISYWGYHTFHSGIKIGTHFNLKKWDKTKKGKKGTLVKHKTRFISPQIGMYHHQKNHTSLLINADFGVEISKNEKHFFNAFSFGFGYIRQFNSGLTYVLEEDGIGEKESASRGYLMPSLNYELGQHYRTMSWFSKFTLASKLKYNTGVSANFFFEAGIKFYLNQ